MASSCKLELAEFSTLLISKTESSVAKEQNYMGGDTAHTFLMSGTNGMGTPQNIERKHILGGGTPHILFIGGNNWNGNIQILGGGHHTYLVDGQRCILGVGHRTILKDKFE